MMRFLVPQDANSASSNVLQYGYRQYSGTFLPRKITVAKNRTRQTSMKYTVMIIVKPYKFYDSASFTPPKRVGNVRQAINLINIFIFKRLCDSKSYASWFCLSVS